MSAALRAGLNTANRINTATRPDSMMTTHRIRKSSMYRFHDSARNDRKFILAAAAAALIFAVLLASLGVDFFRNPLK